MRKLAIVGKGTAGALSALHMSKYMRDCEFEWYYDNDTPPQAVGEGSNLVLPYNLHRALDFYHQDLEKIDGTFKSGVYKIGWNGSNFMNPFFPPNVAYHFNANKLQDYIFEKIGNKFTVIDKKVNSADIDADFIVDCGGKPSSYEDFNKTEYIPVNSVHVTQCAWDHPRFQYTLAIARPYGWVFGIPLTNRCSIGYMYNNEINTLEEVKEDAQLIINDLLLEPTSTNSFSFNNYYRKQNYSDDGRIAYNGNASFFLEPLEATSIHMMDSVQRLALDMWNNRPGYTLEKVNAEYTRRILEIQRVIMLHYSAGSRFNTPFWQMAQEDGNRCIEELKSDPKFIEFYKGVKNPNLDIGPSYGTWGYRTFRVNLREMGLYPKIDGLMA